ncbi:MAG TPA: ABC transporter permease [Vicinamibacterales bacterium]
MRQALRYAFDEAVRSLWRGRQSGLLSTATIALALFVLGAFLLVTANLERLGTEWSRAAEMSVYLKDDISQEDRAKVERLLTSSDLVAGKEYVSKADALARFKQTFADLAGAVDGLGENPLPASYEVRLRTNDQGSASTALEHLASNLGQAGGVADVRYDRQWLSRVMSAIGVVRTVGLLLGGVLTIAAALTVANVVRLALYARRDELEIMHLVGAPQIYVRGPFVMEGILQGGVGALAAVLALGAVFLATRSSYLVPLASAVNLTSIQFLPWQISVLLVLGGMAVGCLGGLVAARLTQS